MSQILLPPPAESQPEPATTTVAEPRPVYEPDPPKQPSVFWRAVKWPLRQLFKAIYFTGAAANRHHAVAAIMLVVVLLLGGGTYAVYRVTHPQTDAAGQQVRSGVPSLGNLPLTAVSSTLPPLPASVGYWLHGHQTFNAPEMWASVSPQGQALLAQQSSTEQSLQSELDQEKAAGFTYDQFIYTGGYVAQNGYAYYTISAVVDKGPQRVSERFWYFVIDPSQQIILPIDLSPSPLPSA
jgi:hypothetical protein